MLNKRAMAFKNSKNEDGIALAIGGSVVLGTILLPYSVAMGACTIGIGALGLVSKIFLDKENKEESEVNVIEKLLFENGLRYHEGEGKFSIPEVVDVREFERGLKVDLKVPIGFTQRDLMIRGSAAIKDYFNCIDVTFNPVGKDIYEMEMLMEDEKQEPLSAWDVLWLENGIYTGEKPNVKLPKLLKIVAIDGGKGFVFELPLGRSTSHIKKIVDTIKEFLNARSVDVVHLKSNIVSIEAIYGGVPERVDYEVVAKENENCLEVVIGASMGGFVHLNLTSMPNLLIAGATGSGKSVTTKAILMDLFCKYSTDELKVHLIDFKKTELIRFKNIKHVVSYADELEEADKVIKELVAECERRTELFKEVGASDISEYNELVPKEEKLENIVLVIEEFVRYARGNDGREKKERQNRLSELLYICRATGINTIVTVQRPTKNNLDEDIKASLTNIIGLRTVNKDNSKIICGDDKLLKGLSGKGHGYLFNDLGTTEFRGFYLSNDDIKKYIKEYDLSK